MELPRFGIGMGSSNLFGGSFPFNLRSGNVEKTPALESADIQDAPSDPAPQARATNDQANQQGVLQQLCSLLLALLKKLVKGDSDSDDADTGNAGSGDTTSPSDIGSQATNLNNAGQPSAQPPSVDDSDIQNAKTVQPASTPSQTPPATGTPPTTDTPATTATPSDSKTSSAGSIGDINVDGGGKNTITIKNNSDKEQNYALFSNPGPGQVSSFGVPNGFVTLKPGESVNLKVPDQHSGYVQQMNNYSEADYKAGKAPDANNFKATRAEYTFNSDGSLYFNDSNIDGYNASLKMSSEGQVAGSSESILAKVKQSNPGLISNVGGQEVIEGAQFFSSNTNIEARNAIDENINHNSNPDDLNGNTTTYAMPNDDKAVRGTKSNSLLLEFGNA